MRRILFSAGLTFILSLTLRSQSLINVDLGAGTATTKTGPAAVGVGSSDFWNFYSRDDGQGGWRTLGGLANLKYSDSTVSPAGFTIANAPGAWGNGSSDPMLDGYLYPFSGNATITITNLPAGACDFYLYSHDGHYQISVGSTSYGTHANRQAPVVNPPVWQEGQQYSKFSNIPISAGDNVTITILPGVDGYAVLSGFQIVSSASASGVPPTIIDQPHNQTTIVGGSATFSVTAAGSSPLSYQWHHGGSDISGATTSVLALSGIQSSDAGTYSVTVTNGYGSVTSSDATLTVHDVGPFSMIDVDFGAGSSSKTGFAATGLTTNDYWNFYNRDDGHGGWLVNGSLPNLKYVDGSISPAGLTVNNGPGAWGNGSSDPMYNSYIYPFNGDLVATVTNLPAGSYDFYVYSHDGNYTISVDGTSYGSQTTRESPVVNPPVWEEGRQYALFHSVPVAAGQNVALTVAPGLDGYAIISGLQIAPPTTFVGTPPSITTQPQNQTAVTGAGVSFSVVARGTAPLSYQWHHNGSDIAGATVSALNLSNIQSSDGGTYSVTVTNAYGSVNSSDATLTVQSAGTFSMLDIDFGAGATTSKAGFAATGVTTNDFWNFYSRDNGNGGWNVNGSLANLKYVDGSISAAGLTVNNGPGAWGNGSTDPMYDGYIYPLGPGNLVATVTNLPPGSYDLYVYSQDGNYTLSVDGTSYGTQTTRESPVVNPPVWQEGKQYALFHSVAVGAGQTVTLTVAPGLDGYAILAGLQIAPPTPFVGTAPSITTQPQSQTAVVGAGVSFTVVAHGTAPLSYQWHHNGSDIAGATGSALNLSNLQSGDAGAYSVTVTNDYGSATSSDATLTVQDAGAFSMIDIDFGAGASTTKTGLAATGVTTNDYWNFYTRDDGNGGWNANGSLPNLKYVDGSVSAAGLTVNNGPGAWGNGSSDPMYHSYIYPFGSNLVATVTNLPAGSYDFYVYSQDGNYTLSVDGTSYGTQTTWESPVVNPPVWQEGKQYALFHSVAVGAGQTVTLTVAPGAAGYAILAGLQIAPPTTFAGTPPSIITQPQSKTAVAGAGVSFSVVAHGTAPLSFQWHHNGSDITAATSSALNLSNVQSSDAGAYSVTVTNAYGSVTSSDATLTVQDAGAFSMIDVDFGAGATTTKTGLAATGVTTNDFWNFYSRDDANGGWLVNGSLPNLKYVDGSISAAGLTINNGQGAWGNGSSDPMYDSYIYPLGPGNLLATVTNLPAGSYDFYIYSQDGNYTLSVGGSSYGTETSRDWPIANPPAWQEGKQYALFHSVTVGAGQPVTITVAPGLDGYAIISGLQIAPPTTFAGTPPSITTQPQSQTAGVGSSATLSVTVKGTAPLSYQWHHDGTDITGATGSALVLNNLQATDAGAYSVTVTNAYGSVISSDANLTVQDATTYSLIDINFGAGDNSGLNAQKTGFAATGVSSNDFWNFYSRDDGHGGFLQSASLPNLKLVDGSISAVGLTVSNAPGAWANGSTDPMYNTYVYPLGPGYLTATLTNLPAGTYDIYAYSQDGNYMLSVGGATYGPKTSRESPVVNPTVWQEGKQYARFTGITVADGQTVTLTAAPGVDGYAILSGMQIAATGMDRPPAAGTVNAGTVQNKSVSLPVSTLLSATLSEDGTLVNLTSISTNSASGAKVVTRAGTLTYSPVTNFTGLDYFTYTVADTRGIKSMGYVLVNVRSADVASGYILPLTPLAEGGFNVSFAGLPGRTYKLQRAASPNGPWTNMAPITIDFSGVGVFKDTNPPKAAGFYRTLYP